MPRKRLITADGNIATMPFHQKVLSLARLGLIGMISALTQPVIFWYSGQALQLGAVEETSNAMALDGIMLVAW